jgi:hypothetical protein
MLDAERVLYEVRYEYFVQLAGREYAKSCYLEVERYCLPKNSMSETVTQIGRKGMLCTLYQQYYIILTIRIIQEVFVSEQFAVERTTSFLNSKR